MTSWPCNGLSGAGALVAENGGNPRRAVITATRSGTATAGLPVTLPTRKAPG
jgi:hypothetical protein